MTTNGPPHPRQGRRRLRTATDITAAVMIVAGAVLAGISVSQHQDRDHALAVQAAHKAQVDRAALAEAQQFRALANTKAAQASARSNADREARVEVPQLRTAGLVLAADHQAAAKTAGPTAGAHSVPTAAATTGRHQRGHACRRSGVRAQRWSSPRSRCTPRWSPLER